MQAPAKPRLFNIINPVSNRPSYTVNYYAGNIIDRQVDILVLSAYSGSFSPTPGTIFGAINDRFTRNYNSIKYDRISDNVIVFDEGNTHLPWKKMVVLEMIDSANYEELSLIKSRFNEFTQCAPRFISNKDFSLSIPLIGTGNQGLSKEIVAVELIEVAKSFSTSNLKDFNVFAFDIEAVAIINIKINGMTSRQSSNPMEQRLVAAMSEELRTLSNGSNPLINESIEELLNLLSSPNVGINPIAMQGRIFAELYARMYFEKWVHTTDLALSDNRLESYIKSISSCLRQQNKSYLLSYLRLLQACGNMAVHGGERQLVDMDIVAIMVAVVRLAQDI